MVATKKINREILTHVPLKITEEDYVIFQEHIIIVTTRGVFTVKPSIRYVREDPQYDDYFIEDEIDGDSVSKTIKSNRIKDEEIVAIIDITIDFESGINNIIIYKK